MTNPDPKTFSISDVLQGRGYPETEVVTYLNEKIAYGISVLKTQLDRLALLGDNDAYAEKDKEFQGLVRELASEAYTFHLRSIPRKAKKDILKVVETKYPDVTKTDFLGRPEKPTPEADEYLQTLLWEAHLVQIVAPDGSVSTPDFDGVQELRDYAPDAALSAIQAGIDELTTGAKAGFETAAQASDFLPQP